METYNYFENVKEDVKTVMSDYNYEKRFSDRYELEDQMNEDLFCNDSVTGNGSGSYFFNAWRSEEAICHNWDIINDMIADDYIQLSQIQDGAETLDVCIRCYFLSGAISEVLDELEESGEIEKYLTD